MFETLLVINILLLSVVAFVELSFAVNQWNMAVKAVQAGARLASVSDPVDSGLKAFSGLNPATPGDPSPSYWSRCTAGSCTGSGNIAHVYDANAMSRLFFGSDQNRTAAQGTILGMGDIFPSPAFTTANIEISYTFEGLGFAGRPGGPVPVIQVTLKNITFDFTLLGAFLAPIFPLSFTATAVGEDLSRVYP